MKKAFTLIEIVITVSIIALLAIVAIPNLQDYKQKTDYQSKQNEIEVLVNDLQAMSKNAEQGYTIYSLTISSDKKVALNKKIDAAGAPFEMESVAPSKNQTFEPQNEFDEIYCIVPGNVCRMKKTLGAEITLSTANGIQFLTITDSNFSPAKIATFEIYGSPLRVKITP